MLSRDVIFNGSLGMVVFIAFLLLLFVAWPSYHKTVVEQFDGYPAGTIVAGKLPGGESAAGDFFPGFTLSVTNAGGGPHSIVLDEASMGAGSQAAQSGADVAPFVNRLIIAEGIVDASPGDGLVDHPAGEPGGGIVTFSFRSPTTIFELSFSEIGEASRVGCTLYAGEAQIGSAQTSACGANAAEILSMESFKNLSAL